MTPDSPDGFSPDRLTSLLAEQAGAAQPSLPTAHRIAARSRVLRRRRTAVTSGAALVAAAGVGVLATRPSAPVPVEVGGPGTTAATTPGTVDPADVIDPTQPNVTIPDSTVPDVTVDPNATGEPADPPVADLGLEQLQVFGLSLPDREPTTVVVFRTPGDFVAYASPDRTRSVHFTVHDVESNPARNLSELRWTLDPQDLVLADGRVVQMADRPALPDGTPAGTQVALEIGDDQVFVDATGLSLDELRIALAAVVVAEDGTVAVPPSSLPADLEVVPESLLPIPQVSQSITTLTYALPDGVRVDVSTHEFAETVPTTVLSGDAIEVRGHEAKVTTYDGPPLPTGTGATTTNVTWFESPLLQVSISIMTPAGSTAPDLQQILDAVAEVDPITIAMPPAPRTLP